VTQGFFLFLGIFGVVLSAIVVPMNYSYRKQYKRDKDDPIFGRIISKGQVVGNTIMATIIVIGGAFFAYVGFGVFFFLN
jgi:hypothetical protein